MSTKLAVGALFSLIGFCALQAQTTRGTILGTVTDQSGAVMPGVTVTVRETSTGLTRTDTTNNSGDYLMPELPVGPYTVEAVKQGFVKVERSGLTLQVDQKMRVDISMQVGQVTQQLVVESTAPVIATDSATVGNVVDNKKVTELPLNGRNFLQLNLLVPGANQGVKGSQNQGQGGSISVNGAREAANNFLLDATDNNDLAINQYSVAISPEAIQEFKVQASTYSAEFGRSGGAQINVATRSGTNAFHGVLYEYFRNAKLDAKNFFDVPTRPIPPYKRNQFGGSLGGPIRKNKTFFFGNYEGTRIRQSITKVSTVPTTAMKSGDFRALLGPQIGTDALGRPVYSGEIFDPSTLHFVNGQPVRDSFPTMNVIPANRITPTGANIAASFPNPNTQFGPASGQYTASPGAMDDFNQFTTRLDHSFGASDNFFARYTWSKEARFNTFDPFCSTTNIPGFGCNTGNVGQNATVNYTHLFGATKVNELRIGFNRLSNFIYQQDQGKDFSTQLGVLGTSRSPIDFGYPSVGVAGFDGIGDAGNLPQRRHDNTFDYSDSFSWVIGNHSLKFGADARRFQLNLLFDSNARGTLTFSPFYTADPTLKSGSVAALAGTGNALAELLLGDPFTASVSRSFGGVTANTVTAFRVTSVNPFIQDDWRVTPKLTLNLGLRWEYNSPVVDKYNHLSTFDPTVPGDIRVSTSSKPNLYDVSKKNFAPRFGFAWSPFGQKTVLRGGYGMFWDEKLLNILLTPALSPPFVVPLTFNSASNGIPNINLANPYLGGTAPPFSSATWLESPFRDGYLQQWSFNIERQFSQSVGLTVGYVGSKGTHLDREYNANLPQPSPVFLQANRPYPNFSGITVDSASASSDYNALQISGEKRFSGGLSFLAAYTYSKSIDDASAWGAGVVDPFNFHLERGLSTFDARNRFVFSYTYDVPFGRGRAFGSSIPGWANEIFGGWQSNGILTLQSGNPVDVTVGLTSLTGTQSTTRPDLIGDPNNGPGIHDPAHWFNTAAFSDNFVGRFGDAGRDVVIGPGTQDFDFALLKNFPLWKESRYVQFRSEIFNIFNHPNFDNPVTSEVSPSFGKILSAGAQDARLSSRQIQFALRLVF